MTQEFKLITEGEWSEDGRYVVLGSTSWREPPLPLRAPPDPDNPNDPAPIIGRVTRVWREDNVIKCEGEFFTDALATSITVDTDTATVEADDDFNLVITNPRIMGGVVWEDDRYIWRRDES